MPRPQANNVTLDFSIQSGPNLINIPFALSLLNRKSYRAGRVYSVDYVEYIGTAGDEVRTACLPFSYPLFAAYKLGFQMWLEQRAESIDESGIEPGKWSDFKPYYNINHLDGTLPQRYPMGMSAGTGFTLVPLDTTNAEWNGAEIVRNDHAAATTTTIAVGMLGDDDLAAATPYGSLMDAYGSTRVATLAPDPLLPTDASGSWITRTGEQSGEMSERVINLLEDENDFPPYANQNDVTLAPTYVGNGQSAPGGIMMDTTVTGTTGRAVTLNGGLVPLGLMPVTLGGGASGILRVHCTRGDYKGVASLSMGDFS